MIRPLGGDNHPLDIGGGALRASDNRHCGDERLCRTAKHQSLQQIIYENSPLRPIAALDSALFRAGL
jgi:hypothetical protein